MYSSSQKENDKHKQTQTHLLIKTNESPIIIIIAGGKDRS